MNIIAVDDERRALNVLLRAILEAVPDCLTTGFNDAADVLQHAEDTNIDVAFLDIHMGGLDGLALAKKLKAIQSRINIIFVTGYIDHALDAFKLHASGYICKPVSPDAVKKEIANLRHAAASRVCVQTFGNFDVFVDGVPISFRRSKAKEILAYLVDRRGATVTKKELAAILWEKQEYSRSTQTHLQILITEMLGTLGQAGAENIVRREYNSLSVVADQFDCDYYNFIKGDKQSIASYQGEYMANYSWAELTAGALSEYKV